METLRLWLAHALNCAARVLMEAARWCALASRRLIPDDDPRQMRLRGLGD